MLKYFCRTSTLRKYFNTKILQHRSREEHMERVTAMEKFFERNWICGYHVYKKSMGGNGWRDVGVRKRAQNPSDQYAVAVKNKGTIIEHLPRKLLHVCSLLCDREVHNSKCECQTRARGMARSIICIVIIHCRKNSL